MPKRMRKFSDGEDEEKEIYGKITFIYLKFEAFARKKNVFILR